MGHIGIAWFSAKRAAPTEIEICRHKAVVVLEMLGLEQVSRKTDAFEVGLRGGQGVY